MLGECAVVGGDGTVVVALPRQRVAQVVQAGIAVDAFEARARRIKIAVAVGLHAFGDAFVLALVGTLPERAGFPGRCVAGLRLQVA